MRFTNFSELSRRQRNILRNHWKLRTKTSSLAEPSRKFSEKEKKILVNKLKSAEFSSYKQKSLRSLEGDHFRHGMKKRIIQESLGSKNNSSYFSFFVCRKPVDRLVSIYNYLSYMFSKFSLKGSRFVYKSLYEHEQ